MTENEAGEHYTWMLCMKFSCRNGLLQDGPCDSLLCWQTIANDDGPKCLPKPKANRREKQFKINNARITRYAETDDFSKALLLGMNILQTIGERSVRF